MENIDHDLLIRIDTKVDRLSLDLKEHSSKVDNLSIRITAFERHIPMSMLGNFLDSQGTLASKWNETSEDVIWFKRTGKWIWAIIIVILDIFIATGSHFIWFGFK